LGKGETTLDVVEQQAVGFICRLDLDDQLFLQLFAR